MKFFKNIFGAFGALFSVFLFSFAASAENFTEEDKMAFGIMPIWLFLLILAGVTALAIIIIIEFFKRRHK